MSIKASREILAKNTSLFWNRENLIKSSDCYHWGRGPDESRALSRRQVSQLAGCHSPWCVLGTKDARECRPRTESGFFPSWAHQFSTLMVRSHCSWVELLPVLCV